MVAKTSLKVEHHGQARKITCQQQTNQSKLTFVQTNTTHRIKQHPLSKVILKLRKLFFLVFFLPVEYPEDQLHFSNLTVPK